MIYFGYRLNIGELVAQFDNNLFVAGLVIQVPMAIAFFYAWSPAIPVWTPAIPMIPAMEAVVLSSALNVVLPGRISEVIKAVYLRSRLGVPLPSGLSAITIERLFDLAIVRAIAATGVAGTFVPNSWCLLAVPLGAIIALAVIRPVCSALMRLTSSEHRVIGFIHRYCRHIVSVLSTTRAIRASLLMVSSWVAHFSAFGCFSSCSLFMRSPSGTWPQYLARSFLPARPPRCPPASGCSRRLVVVVLQPLGFEFHQALATAIALHAGELFLSVTIGPAVMLYRSTGFAARAKHAVSMMRKSGDG